ncbi:MAG: hypothetical protein ACI9QC_000250 [Oceanicoccus sp.]|jgi:hypothetical protein
MSDFKITKEDVKTILADSKFIDEVIGKALRDPEIFKDLAEGLADVLAESLRTDPKFKKKLIEAVHGDKNFKKTLLEELSDNLGDDLS